MKPSSQRQNNESKPYRARYPANCTSARATLYNSERSRTEDYGEPEAEYYVDRDPWYTHSQLGRPCSETVWGHRMTMPRSAPAQNAVLAPVCPMQNAVTAPAQTTPGEVDMIRGARRHLPLDAPDVALREQRLLVYGERVRRVKAEAVYPEKGHACHSARPRRPMARQQWPEAADRRTPTPPVADGGDDIRPLGRPRQLRAEERISGTFGGSRIGRRNSWLHWLHRNAAVAHVHRDSYPKVRRRTLGM